mmetsp:Transcript_10261/g.13466  ORF Transcript_10261/g.13466 Transcript_10261/m.13466 type:complete len:459 (+) Transcript_10261:142-1518(+)|eukprot:CAMPEP_0184016516 /NCGR_PEP_ID=MMETSP0954-20121128/6972_1 /TAXON_ID=627963 /ORGANISM="Aplanochytrium sp, Strain PBS07" /LENGTH=458 /DNA_ID=CAMNT_0026297545 /DNA_START=108 /DNA_END=1484 /DNA_ORIENTATION=+
MDNWITEVLRVHYSDAVAIRQGQNGSFSVHAKRDILSGSVVAEIPKAALLSLKNVPTVTELLIKYHLDQDEDLALSTAILYEKLKGKESNWYGYLESIPDESIRTPLSLSPETLLRNLQGLSFLQDIIDEKERIRLAWTHAVRPLLEECLPSITHRRLTLEAFVRCFQIQSSRAFFADEEHRDSLIPFADLLNHKISVLSFDLAIEGKDEESKTEVSPKAIEEHLKPEILVGNVDSTSKIVLTALKDVKSGKEIFNTYGECANSMLFMEYGFALPDNPFNVMKLFLPLLSDVGMTDRSWRRRFRTIETISQSDSVATDVLEILEDGFIPVKTGESGIWTMSNVAWAVLVTCTDSIFDDIQSNGSIEVIVMQAVEPGSVGITKVSQDVASCFVTACNLLKHMANSKLKELISRRKGQEMDFIYAKEAKILYDDEIELLERALSELKNRELSFKSCIVER